MPDTLVALAIAVAFVLPGFITADLAESRRATRASRSDLELVLRGLVYALIIQASVAATGWTQMIVDDVSTSQSEATSLSASHHSQLVVDAGVSPAVGSSASHAKPTSLQKPEQATATSNDDRAPWTRHLSELVVFALVVGVLIPTALGLALSWWLRRAEVEGGKLKPWHLALGGRDYRKAWDFVFARDEGTYVLLTLVDDHGEQHFLGKYGKDSWATQAPTQPAELFLEEAWPSDPDGGVPEDVLDQTPKRGMWISSDRIDRLEVLDLGDKAN